MTKRQKKYKKDTLRTIVTVLLALVFLLSCLLIISMIAQLMSSATLNFTFYSNSAGFMNITVSNGQSIYILHEVFRNSSVPILYTTDLPNLKTNTVYNVSLTGRLYSTVRDFPCRPVEPGPIRPMATTNSSNLVIVPFQCSFNEIIQINSTFQTETGGPNSIKNVSLNQGEIFIEP